MPFGLKNSGATFTRALRPLLGHLPFVCIYLHTVFKILQENHFYLKDAKTQLFRTRLKYLGFIIGGGEIIPQYDKIAAITRIPEPTTRRKTQAFLGAANYYRRWIPRFSELTACLYALTEKKAKFEWKNQHSQAFTAIKKLLTQPPLLRIFHPSRETRLYTDASLHGIGAVLTQIIDGVEVVIEYFSKRLPNAKKYTTPYFSEAYAITNRWYPCLQDVPTRT
mmetsp:Transcript_11530/g.30666  ORF Transcript_11530/g.30666 Transcript_11530/m.30666 type:complete len:222 (+) Transcript_11530:332-997(+)